MTVKHKSRSICMAGAFSMLLRRVTIGLLTTILCASAAAASDKTGREKNGLIGPVRSVVTMAADLSQTESYDRAGHLVEAVIYLQDENSATRYVFTYNQLGEQQEEVAHSPDGTILYRKLFAHARDRAGRETALVAASQDGEFHHAEFSIYDRDGMASETIHTDGTATSRNLFDVLGRLLYSGRYREGRLLGELSWTYAVDGRVMALTSYSADGAVTGKSLHEYDVSGRRVRTTTETIQHGATSRWITLYEYDGAGNWIKEVTRKQTNQPSDIGTDSTQIVQERLIDYYDERRRVAAGCEEERGKSFGSCRRSALACSHPSPVWGPRSARQGTQIGATRNSLSVGEGKALPLARK